MNEFDASQSRKGAAITTAVILVSAAKPRLAPARIAMPFMAAAFIHEPNAKFRKATNQNEVT